MLSNDVSKFFPNETRERSRNLQLPMYLLTSVFCILEFFQRSIYFRTQGLQRCLRNSYTKLLWIFYLNYSCWCCLALGVRLIWHCSWGLTDGWGMRGLKTHVQITTITITRNIRKRQKKKPLMKPHVQSCDMVFGYWSLNLSSTTYSRGESGQKRIHFHTWGAITYI